MLLLVSGIKSKNAVKKWWNKMSNNCAKGEISEIQYKYSITYNVSRDNSTTFVENLGKNSP